MRYVKFTLIYKFAVSGKVGYTIHKVMQKEDITCPKCGFKQQENTECLRCGIVFAKFAPLRNLPDYSGHEGTKRSAHLETNTIIEETDRWIYRTGKYFIVSIMGLLFFYMVIKRSS